MTGVIRTQLSRLAGTIAELKERVRTAVAGELGRAVAGAVQQVVQAAVAGRADAPRPEFPPAYRRPAPPGRWDDEDDEDDDRWGRPRDPWADDPDDEYDRAGRPAAPLRHDDPPPADPGVTAAVAAGVAAARWWVTRKGTWLAAGLGLGIGLLGVLGGPVVRTTVALVAAAADVLAATDALGAGAARLGHV